MGIFAHLFIARGDPCSPFHHTRGSLLTFSSHVGILAHLFITRGDPCSPFHHTSGSLLTFSSRGDPCSPFHHTWGSLLTFSSHVGILAHLFITRGDPCSPFHHTWGSLLTFSSHMGILAHFSSHMGILAHLFITRVGIPGLCPLEVVGDWVWAKLGWSSLLTLGLHMMILHLLILTLLMHQRAWSFPSMPLSMVFLGKQHTEHHGKPQRLESHTLLAHRRVLPLLHFLRMLHKPEIQRCWNKNCQVLFHKILIGL